MSERALPPSLGWWGDKCLGEGEGQGGDLGVGGVPKKELDMKIKGSYFGVVLVQLWFLGEVTDFGGSRRVGEDFGG